MLLENHIFFMLIGFCLFSKCIRTCLGVLLWCTKSVKINIGCEELPRILNRNEFMSNLRIGTFTINSLYKINLKTSLLRILKSNFR